MSENKRHNIEEEVWKQIRNALEQIQFGSVTIVVHEGKVVQIETNEKKRLS